MAQWMWADEEIEQLVEWLKEHNEQLPSKDLAGIYGMDVYGGENSLSAIENIFYQKIYECPSNVKDDFTQCPNYLAQRNQPCNAESK